MTVENAAQFVKVCELAEIPADGALGVEVGDTPVALVRSGDDVFAVNDICSHAEVSLSEGEVYDGTIECWLHGSCFDLRSGKPTNPPATQAIATYKIKVEDGGVYVSLDSGADD
jgi:3-phenylpropionate/trans-cinnamate dioxygenase ferredoxin subunit